MKMIIDIPEGMLEAIRDGYWSGSHKLELAIRNGTPYNPSGDLISREDLKKEVENLVTGGAEGLKDYYENGTKSDENSWIGGVYDAWELIDNAPTVDLDERDNDAFETGYIKGLCENRPHGKWVNTSGYASECSICKTPEIFPTYNFCPNCGADMRGEDHEKS